MMKIMLVVFVLAGLGLAGVYYLGGYDDFDPTAIGNEKKAQITPGLHWTRVLEIAERPCGYAALMEVTEEDVDGESVTVVKRGPRCKFERQIVQGSIDDGIASAGFVLEYFFSPQVAFEVIFDAAGCVEQLQDVATMADLLQTRDGG